MKNLPMLNNLSHAEKDELIIKLWEENQRLKAELQALKGQASCNGTPITPLKNGKFVSLINCEIANTQLKRVTN